MQTARDQLGQQQTQGLHVRGPACWHAMQGVLSAMMAGRQAPESDKPMPKPSHVVATRSSKKRRKHRNRRRRFLAAHRVPTLYTSQECVPSQALVLSLERTGRKGDFRVVSVDRLGHMPSFLANIPALVDKNGIYDGPDLIDVISTYCAAQSGDCPRIAKRKLQTSKRSDHT